MIKNEALKENVIEIIKQIHAFKNIGVGAKLLLESVILKHEDWKISWSFFAKEFGVSKMSILRWKDELIKAGIWQVIEGVDEKGQKEIIVEFCENVFDLSGNNLVKSNNLGHYKKREICKISQEQKRNFIPQNENLVFESKNLAFENENSKQNSSTSLIFCEGENTQKSEAKAENKGIEKPLSKEQKASVKEKNALNLAKTCFESLDLSAFSEAERAGILEFFEFRARNVRKSPFSEHTAQKLLKQFEKSKSQGINICAVFDRCIANSWVGYEWGEVSILKEQKHKQWYGTAQQSVAKGEPTWQEIKDAPTASLLDDEGIPLFVNRFAEHGFITQELMKIDSEGRFYAWSDDELAKIRILGDKQIKRVLGQFYFVRKPKKVVVDENILKQRHFSIGTNIGEFLAANLSKKA